MAMVTTMAVLAISMLVINVVGASVVVMVVPVVLVMGGVARMNAHAPPVVV